MRIHILTATWPPDVCGIGDYSALIAQQLSKAADVTILTTNNGERRPIDDIAVRQVFNHAIKRDVRRIKSVIEADRPDWLLVQYLQRPSSGVWTGGWLSGAQDAEEQASQKPGSTVHNAYDSLRASDEETAKSNPSVYFA